MNKIFLMRHGLTEYKQGRVSIDDACDIVDEAKPILRESAKQINERSKTQGISIASSPYGRALASAKEVYAQLQEQGAKPGDIVIDKDLEEIRGFDYSIMHALARGKKLEFGGNTYIFDIQKTNPWKLSEVQFFRQDQIHDKNYQKTLPTEIQNRIKEMETCKSAEKRLTNVLERTISESILVTHEGPTGMFVTRYVGLQDAYLDRAGFIQLEEFAGQWYPTYINKIELDKYSGKDI